MTTRSYGILASVIGSAIGAWWWARHGVRRNRTRAAAREQGTVIFDNTPTAPDTSGQGIV